MNALASYGWPLNFAELNTVISQAVAVSQGKTIEEEHIFFDIRSSLQPAGEMNLLRKKGISEFLRHRLVPEVLQYVTVPFFLCLIFYTLFGPREQNLGNIIAWSLLWPFLLLSVLVSGRGFCAYCPISAVSNAFAYGRKKFLSFTGLMKKYGVWTGIAAFRLDFLDRACHRGISQCSCYRNSLFFHNGQRDHCNTALWKENVVSPYLSAGENVG